MKTLIVYASMHGCTEQVVEKLKADLTGEVKIQNLKDKTPIFVNAFDTILIGGSIHAGMIQGSVKKFCKKQMDTLLQKQVGLFLCCMDQDRAQEQFDNAFPEALRLHAKVQGLFGGAFDFDKMNFIQKAIIKKISGVEDSVNNLNETAIHKFIEALK
ncbi:flavodoxin domain-containing protein [bacterium]